MKLRTKSALATAVALAIVAGSSSAQVLEEVVVTSTKRSVGLQDVPIAISVMTGEVIEEKGLTNLEDMTVYMPNVFVAEGSAADTLFIRGVGSGVNYGFEQSVGTFVDGVYFGRGRSSRSKFLDLERVEVLKGPQSTLFGKNTIAGAINISTAKPTEDFKGYVDFSYRTELDAYKYTGMVSGAISDNLRGRLVAQKYDDDGYVENHATGEDGPAQDNYAVRGSLAWEPTDNLSLLFKAEVSQNNVDGRQQVIMKANPTATGLYRAFGHPGF